MHKQVRGFAEGKGPRCFHEPKNYNQRFSQFIEDSLYECEDRPTNFPHLVESYFQENLLRRFNMIKFLKAEIRREKMKNEVKRRLIQDQKTKNDQRQLSKTLVNSFKQCIDTVVGDKEKRV